MKLNRLLTTVISSCIAQREIETGEEPFTLIAVAVCGGNYSGEWESNVTVGEADRHQGFSDAAELVENRILGYIARQKLSDQKIKIWISGSPALPSGTMWETTFFCA